MVDYFWDIREMKNNSADGGVFEVTWLCSGVRSKFDAQGQEHTYEISNIGVCEFEPTPSESGFTPLSNLTKEQVLGWVWGRVDKSLVEQGIADGLQQTYFDTSVDNTIPWANSNGN